MNVSEFEQNFTQDETTVTNVFLTLRNHGVNCERQTLQAPLPKRKKNTETIVCCINVLKYKQNYVSQEHERSRCIFTYSPHNTNNTNVTQDTAARFDL